MQQIISHFQDLLKFMRRQILAFFRNNWTFFCHCYGVPLQGHLQGQTRDNWNMPFFHYSKEHIYMCYYIISVVLYICLVFPVETKTCLGSMHFCAPHAALNRKIIITPQICNPFKAIFRVYLRSWSVSFGYLFKIIESVLSLL